MESVGASARRPAERAGTGVADRRRATRHIDGLFDLRLAHTPDGELVDPHDPLVPLDPPRLAELVQQAGGAGDDVRILLPDGALHRGLFADLAGLLDHDVYISPSRALLRYRPGNGGLGHPEATLIDPVDGRHVDWLVVQPPGRAAGGPGWFEVAGGVLRPRSGMVMLPLSGGVAYATRTDFVAWRAKAARLWQGHVGLVTIGAALGAQGFVVGDYGGGQEMLGGRQLAAALGGTALYGADVRIWADWPPDPAEHERVAQSLAEFAHACGTTVWAVEPGAAVKIRDGCHDLAAVDGAGRPAGWRAYRPARATQPWFTPDTDGRLVPVGGVAAVAHPGIPLISVSPGRQREMSDRYARLPPQRGLFVVDFAVLGDGRWAARRMDNSLLALGPQGCRDLLRGAGWCGEDLMLLSRYPAEVATQVRHSARHIFADLGAEVWGLPPDADVAVVADRCQAVEKSGHPVAWRRLDVEASQPHERWRSQDGVLLPSDGLETAPATVLATAGQRTHLEPVEPHEPDEPAFDWWNAASSPHPPVVSATDTSLPRGTAPRMAVARRRLPHGIYWLNDRPTVNAEPVELYVVAACPPEQATTRGVPSPHLYLVGLLEPPPPRNLGPDEYLLRVLVEPGGVVDLSSIDVHVPPIVQLMLSAGGPAFLLPAGLLPRVRMSAAFQVQQPGGFVLCREFPDRPRLALRWQGARHGVDGLPDDVPRWPRAGTALAYALISNEQRLSPVPWLALSRRPPKVTAGARLLRLRVPRRQAIDVVTTARQLAGLTATRSGLRALTEARVRLILARRSYAQVTVDQVLVARGGRWRRVRTFEPASLPSLLWSAPVDP